MAFLDQLPTPPAAGSKERSDYLANNRYALIVKVYRSVNRGDLDNYVKTVLDAMQDAGLFADDSQIDRITGEKFIDRENPRIVFTLKQTCGVDQKRLITGESHG